MVRWTKTSICLNSTAIAPVRGQTNHLAPYRFYPIFVSNDERKVFFMDFRPQLDALIDAVMPLAEEGINITRLMVDYENGSLTISVGE